jgi:predicted type IV restriction endonuclease
MELAARIGELQKRMMQHREVLLTEEAAKTALVLPFLQALGYDIFNPGEVVPEFTADVGTKKGEKVDYAIRSGNQISILIECKPVQSELNLNHAGQLFRYFSVTEARLAILTNGVVYQFYTDSDQPNKMDAKPFFSFSLEQPKPTDAKTLEKFQKGTFDIDQIVAEASALKTKSLIRLELEREFAEPSEDFARFVAGKVHEGSITKNVRENVQRLLPSTISEIIRDLVTNRLNSALEAAKPQQKDAVEPATVEAYENITTDDELAGWRIVQAIAAKLVKPDRIVTRDQKSYCAILLDDNNRKSVVRLHFNGITAKYLGTFIHKDETRHLLTDLSDIYHYAPLIEARIEELEKGGG